MSEAWRESAEPLASLCVWASALFALTKPGNAKASSGGSGQQIQTLTLFLFYKPMSRESSRHNTFSINHEKAF